MSVLEEQLLHHSFTALLRSSCSCQLIAFSWKLKNIDHRYNTCASQKQPGVDKRPWYCVLCFSVSYPWWQIRGRQTLLDTSLLLLKESKSSVQAAVLPSCGSPPPEKDNKSDQQPAETELEIAQCVNGENENKRFGDVDPSLGQLARRGHRGVVGYVPRWGMGKVGLNRAGHGVSILLRWRGARTVWMGPSYICHVVPRHVSVLRSPSFKLLKRG